MPIDPEARAVLNALGPNVPTFAGRSVEQARSAAAPLARFVGPAEPVEEVRDLTIPGPAGPLQVRLYRPQVDPGAPLVVFFHGGGWVLGGIEASDRPCRTLANASRSVVASIEYRLSPEVKFPGAAEDCYAATCWLSEHAFDLGVDPERLAIVGESAGGNLAAVVALMARDRGTPRIGFQVLVYPTLAAAEVPHPPRVGNDKNYLITPADLAWFWEQYLVSTADGAHPYAAPMNAQDLSCLPPALVVTVEFDPLREEGDTYARRLTEAGVPTQHSYYPGAIHGIFAMAGAIESGRRLHAEIGQAIIAACTTPTATWPPRAP